MNTFVLMSGGTGGHLFPAMSLAQEMRRRGHVIHLMTDHRVSGYGGKFPARNIYVVRSATPSVKNPIKMISAGIKIAAGTAGAMGTLRKLKPDAVVGFGGYPVFPPFLAASLLGIPGVLHEQNAVMGRANRALARRAKGIALSFEPTKFADAFAHKSVVTGNPVRDIVKELADLRYVPPHENGDIKLLVFGGSQGARVFSDIVPAAIAQLPEPLRRRLVVTQQCRPEDLERVAGQYREARVNVELASFFENLPALMAKSHLTICRSGASSVSELGVLGVPAILVPLPGALDADQKMNAQNMANSGAGWLMEQDTVSPQSLAKRLEELFNAPDTLQSAAVRAKSLGQPHAVERLADFVEHIAARREQ